MKIFRSHWATDSEESEAKLRKELPEIKRFFIAGKEIKDFAIGITDRGTIQVNYSLRKGGRLKYYCSLLNRSFAVANHALIALDDTCWLDFEKGILKKSVFNLVN